MSLITDTIQAYLPGKRKQTPSGWIGFNAPCCGDKRQRGGLIFNAGDAVSYHCFNCQFKASWQPGRAISQKMNKFMRLLNIPDDVISQLRLEALRLNENSNAEVRSIIPTFEARELPPESELITSLLDHIPEKLVPVLEYLHSRKLYLEDYPFYWTPKIGFSNRVIIPFLKDNVIVGYTARAIGDVKPKYISEQQPGYVFNLDRQPYDRQCVIVCEGPIDAISIDACAVMGAEIKDSQNWLLKQLGKEIVLVPDRDHEGPKTVEQAIEFGWSVSMPNWPEGIKDVNDAVCKLGRLATLYLIMQAKESNALKIRLNVKKWFKDIS
jgi:plasmid stability protein